MHLIKASSTEDLSHGRKILFMDKVKFIISEKSIERQDNKTEKPLYISLYLNY